MTGNPAVSFDALRTKIKTRWTELLREGAAAPAAATPLVTPGMLVFLIDESLARLGAGLRTPADPAAAAPDLADFTPTRAGCHCGLHLLLSYYLAGAQALRETLPAGRGRVKVQHLFNHIAHQEMMALCDHCPHRGGKLCGLRPGLASARGKGHLPPSAPLP
jgi:hypothetical protein